MIFIDSNIPMHLIGQDHPNKSAARVATQWLVAEGSRTIIDAERGARFRLTRRQIRGEVAQRVRCATSRRMTRQPRSNERSTNCMIPPCR